MMRMRPQSEPSTDEVLAGLVERVTYYNAENGFCVLRARARGHRDVVTVVGHAAAISAGEWIIASGQWVNDRTHGQQFKAQFLRTSAPTSADGIEKYLSSGMIRGIGPAYAKKLLRAFGEKVFDIIEATPDRLREVDGIGPVRASRITAAWAEQKAVREIMVFLHSHGVGTARAVRIYKTYGPGAIQVMTENPYRLARDIRGIGFKTADAIAMKLGIEKTAMVRVRAGISYALTEAMDEGHCGLPTEELMPLAGGRRPGWRNTVCISGRLASRGAHHRRAADAAGKWQAALALDRSGQGLAVGRGAYRSCPCRKPGRRDPARTDVQGVGHDRWPRRWKNNHR
jgi:exodeoxyribonuclease V alpha subunit